VRAQWENFATELGVREGDIAVRLCNCLIY